MTFLENREKTVHRKELRQSVNFRIAIRVRQFLRKELGKKR